METSKITFQSGWRLIRRGPYLEEVRYIFSVMHFCGFLTEFWIDNTLMSPVYPYFSLKHSEVC